MALWSGRNTQPSTQKMTRGEILAMTEEQKILQKAKAGMKTERIAERRELARKVGREIDRIDRNSSRGKDLVQQEIGRAHGIATSHQRVSFSKEQQMLGQMFGQGDKIWGNVGEPVRINNDLNSSRSDPWDETSSMFGWGPHGERSGMF